MLKLKAIVTAVAMTLPVSAMAQSKADLRKEIEALKAQMKALEARIEKMSSPPAAAPVVAPAAAAAEPVVAAETIDPAEFNRIRVKTEGLEDTQELMGFKGLKITGYVDPTFVYSRAADGGSFVFLNNNYSGDPAGAVNDLEQDTFSYYNSYFGGVTLKFEKEFEGGMKSMVSFRPRRTVSNTYGFGNIIEEAMLWVPLGGLTWKATAGQAISWNGYEYVQANLKKTITSNLLIDFAGPGYTTGAGIEYLQGKWWVKTMVGNLNTSHQAARWDNIGGHWRVDYSKGEFQGWGASGMHGRVYDHGYHYLEADAYFVRGDITVQGQVEWSNWKDAGFDGTTTGHWGASVLGAFKFTPVFEGIVRADYFDNSKGGGGTPALNFGTVCPADTGLDATGATPAATCGDYRNGFGPGTVYDESIGGWAVGDITKGAKRTALTLGLNYQFHTNGLLKTELRYDRSNLNSFYDTKEGTFRKDNLIFGVQTVVGW